MSLYELHVTFQIGLPMKHITMYDIRTLVFRPFTHFLQMLEMFQMFLTETTRMWEMGVGRQRMVSAQAKERNKQTKIYKHHRQ
jgi:hypothetical protein